MKHQASAPHPLDSGTTPLDFWAGTFGNDYTKRNQVDWALRVPLLRRLIEQTEASSFLDVGCNAGWNLRALRSIDSSLEMSGVDVNHEALEQCVAEGFDVVNAPATEIVDTFGPHAAQMVITSGVLIHIPPEQLVDTMQAIIAASSQYVLAIEYDAPTQVEVEYRGHAGRLWKRPYGAIYQQLGLSLVETGVAEGYDDCTYWLLSKE